jgi:hypothetical protein
MLDCDIIVAVKGQGKGKYIFKWDKPSWNYAILFDRK